MHAYVHSFTLVSRVVKHCKCEKHRNNIYDSGCFSQFCSIESSIESNM